MASLGYLVAVMCATASPDPIYTDISHLNTMALASRVRELVYVTDIAQIQPLFERLRDEKKPYVIISNGSNILLPPVLDAVVISPTLLGVHKVKEDKDSVLLEVMAGEDWHTLVVNTVTQGWYGLENLALIPSWVGASPIQNIGAYGVQVEDVIESVQAFHIPTLTWHTLSNSDCEFGYRDSVFKRQVGQWLITQVTFKLHKNPHVNVQYGDVASVAHDFAQQAGRDQVTPIDTMQAIIQIRQRKLPATDELPNCGSFFKNPIVPQTIAAQLLVKYPNLIHYPVKSQDGTLTDQVKLAAGWLIDQAGLKGKGVAPILTHIHQALVLTNHAPNVATQAEVERAMQLIQSTVMQKFGVMLEPEPVWIEADGRIRQTH